MTVQDATFSELRVGIESTFRTAPTGTVYQLMTQSADIKRERTRKRPNVWTGSRRRRPMRVVAAKGSVPVKLPLIYYQSLPFYRGLMLNTPSSHVTVTGTDISFDASTPGANVIEQVAAGLAVFPLGYMVHIRGAATAGNNRWVGPILASSAGSLTVPDGQITTEAAGESITLDFIAIVDKTTPADSDDVSLTLETKNTVLAYRRRMVGGRVDVATWDFANEDFISENFDIKGSAPAKSGSDLGSGIVAGWPVDIDPFGTNEDLKEIYVGNTDLGTRSLCFSQLQIAMRNNRIDQVALAQGNGGPKDYKPGPFDVEITGESYLDADSIALLDAIDAEDTLFAYAVAEDLLGNGMAWLVTAGRAEAEPVTGEVGNLVKFGGFKLEAHDPSKDAASDLYNAGSGPGFQAGLFFSPAP